MDSGNYGSNKKCGLCGLPFDQTDLVYNCVKMHVFHISCYENHKAVTEDISNGLVKKCPKCSAVMDTVAD